MADIKTCLSLGGVLICLGLWQNPADARLLEVGQGKKFTQLRAALNAAQAGDEIRIFAGTYQENELEVKVPIKLIGINTPVIDGQKKSTILRIQAPGVSVRGIKFIDPGFSHLKDHAAIRVEATDALIENNQIQNAHFGLYLSAADRTRVRGNQIKGQAVNESHSANAIHVWKSNELLLENNQVSGHRDGFYFEFVKNSQIRGNTSSHNLRYGLHFMFSDGNSYTHNTFDHNGAGVAVMYTRQIEMRHNRFLDNWGPTAYGLLLKDISRSQIEDNYFSRNTVGIHMEGSSNLTIKNNLIQNNGWAARVHANSMDNQFIDNDFAGNAFDLATNSDSDYTGNRFQNNYWDKYTGYDLNKDGVGDVPYHPVSVFSRLVERVPPSLILLRSFLVQVMDLAERVAPVLTPKAMVDQNPRMKRQS